jgi:UDP-N-acetylglucosamine:LPS N-acetylglucosamine transferase
MQKLNMEGNISHCIAGKNKKLYDELKEKYKNIEVLGYTEDISHYMRLSDVIISKPGGMTLFESIYCITPMFIIRPELMQEMYNARYIEEEGIGKVIWNHERDVFAELKKCFSMK